jgi:excisionase family DNA binding protein
MSHLARTGAGAFARTLPSRHGEPLVAAKISGAERQRRARQRVTSFQQRAMSVRDFCERFGVGRTTTYEEIKGGRLRARKVRKRTIITDDDAEAWLQSLPVVETGPFT